MGKFTDNQAIPAMPNSAPSVSTPPDGNGIQSQAWSEDTREDSCVPLISRVESGEYGDDA